MSDPIRKPVPIRLATVRDLPALVDLHFASFEPKTHLAMVLGRQFIFDIYHWFVSADECFTIVAEDEGRVVGMTTFADVPYNGPMFKHAIRSAVFGVLRRPWVVFQRDLFARLLRFVSGKREYMERPEERDDVSYLAFIAVDPSMRGRGVGVGLLEEGKRLNQTRGHRFVRAGVYRFNEPSIRMFAKAGFDIMPDLQTEHVVFVQVDMQADEAPA